MKEADWRDHAFSFRTFRCLLTVACLSNALAFEIPLQLIRSPFHRQNVIQHRKSGRSTTATASIRSILMMNRMEDTIEGLMDVKDFQSRNRLDKLIGTLQEQLPRTLMEPLTALSTDQVYDQDFQLSVLVSAPNTTPKNNPNGKVKVSNSDKEEKTVANSQILLVRSREELISLSDVLVLAITATKRAQSMLSLSRSSSKKSSSSSVVECQLIIDPSLDRLRVPWKTKVPLLLSTSAISSLSDSGNNVLLEGLSEFALNRTTGKITSHQVAQVSLNGRIINGPEVGQALQAIQSASKNLQQSPFFLPNVFGNDRNNDGTFWKEMRDGILEQAATAAAASSRDDQASIPLPSVLAVDSIEAVEGWISSLDDDSDEVTTTPSVKSYFQEDIPLPGTKEWKEYTIAHESLTEFCNQVIPMLAGTTTTVNPSRRNAPVLVDESVFSSNVTFVGIDGSTLMKGRSLVGNFYQSLSLARKMGTGQDWTVTKFCVLDWRNRTIAVDYEATNSIPPRWKIEGRDMYILSSDQKEGGDATMGKRHPVIEEIKQLEFQASAADGNLIIDSNWLMKNLIRAVEQGRNVANGGSDGNGMVNFGEIISQILIQQGGNLGLGSGLLRPRLNDQGFVKSDKNKFSETAAANTYYLMASLLVEYRDLFDGSAADRRTIAPAAEFLGEDMELQGYLGEALVRGRNAYNRVLGALLSGTRQAIAQKQLIINSDEKSRPKVELVAFDKVRLHVSYSFRLAAPRLLPEIPLPNSNGAPAFGSGASLPLKIELVSDFKVDPNSGEVITHKLVETRVNGQLTPGDVLSRWMQRFLKLDSGAGLEASKGASDEFFQTFVDAVSWFRSLRPPDR